MGFMDSALEVRRVDNYSAHWYEDFTTGDQGSTQMDDFKIVFIFREWYNSLPSYSDATLVYKNGSAHFEVEKAQIARTGCASVFELRTMTEEGLSARLEMLYKTIRPQVVEIIAVVDSVHF